VTPANPLKTLTLTADTLELSEGNTTNLHVEASYKDSTTKTLISGLQWVIGDSTKAQMHNNHVKALKEGSTTLKARYQNLTSNTLHVTIYREVNGHRLPPEPDEELNNKMVLGIDSNNNGVRDDVEIWIFETYDHPIVQAVAMQNARAFQIILVEPEKARETVRFMHNQTDCQSFYTYQDPRKLIPRGKSLYKESRPFILNTRARNRAYYEYNQALSGGVYPGRDSNTDKERCDFNETRILQGEWE
jgi:hypothetical protein